MTYPDTNEQQNTPIFCLKVSLVLLSQLTYKVIHYHFLVHSSDCVG